MSRQHLALAADGNIWLGGSVSGALQPPCESNKTCAEITTRGYDAYLVKISADGRRKLWDRVFGGDGDDFLRKILPAPDGGVVLLIDSGSTNFPVPGANVHPEATAVIRLAADGSVLFARFLDVNPQYLIYDIVFDRRGDLVFTGSFGRLDSLTRFTGRLAITDHAVQLSRYAMGGYALSIDVAGNVLISGAGAEGFGGIETSEGAFQREAPLVFCGTTFVGFPCSHQFVVKLTAGLQTLIFATYLSGNGGSSPSGAPLAWPDGGIAVYGSTGSTDYPTTADAYIGQYPRGVRHES